MKKITALFFACFIMSFGMDVSAYEKYEKTHEDIIFTENGSFIYLDDHLYIIGICAENIDFAKDDFVFIEGHAHKIKHSQDCPLCLKVDKLSYHKITRVILATDNNQEYVKYWSIVAPIWKELGIQPTIVLIGEDIIVNESVGDVIRITPLIDIKTSFQAQVIRLFIPALFPEDICVISDMDIVPNDKGQFFNTYGNFPDNSLIINLNQHYQNDTEKYPLCFLVGKGKVFGEVFKVKTLEDILKKIAQHSLFEFNRLSWGDDEHLLYLYANYWEKQGGNLIKIEPLNLVDYR